MARRFSGIIKSALLAAVIISVAAAGLLCGGKNDSFRFVFMTDIHLMPELRGAEGFAAAIDVVNRLEPDFVITGGDLIYDALAVSYDRADLLYDMYIEACKGFEMPVHHTIGNHEVFGIDQRSGIDTSHPEFGKKMFAARLGGGSTSSSFDFGGWHFILLDTIGISASGGYYGHVGRETLEWLAGDLEKVDPGTPVVLCLHIPLVSPSLQVDYRAADGIPANLIVTNAPEVMAIFEGRDLRLVLQGHLHIVEQAQVKGTKFVTGGAVSAAWWKGPYRDFPEGFVVVDIKDGAIDYHYETYGWDAGE